MKRAVSILAVVLAVNACAAFGEIVARGKFRPFPGDQIPFPAVEQLQFYEEPSRVIEGGAIRWGATAIGLPVQAEDVLGITWAAEYQTDEGQFLAALIHFRRDGGLGFQGGISSYAFVAMDKEPPARKAPAPAKDAKTFEKTFADAGPKPLIVEDDEKKTEPAKEAAKDAPKEEAAPKKEEIAKKAEAAKKAPPGKAAIKKKRGAAAPREGEAPTIGQARIRDVLNRRWALAARFNGATGQPQRGADLFLKAGEDVLLILQRTPK